MNFTIIVNSYGDTKFCFSMERLGLEDAGNVKNYTLKQIWDKNVEIRSKMAYCRYGCAIMNCHYKAPPRSGCALDGFSLICFSAASDGDIYSFEPLPFHEWKGRGDRLTIRRNMNGGTL